MTIENGAMYHVPTWSEKLWRWLGFRYHLGDDPEGINGLPGWMCTELRMRFGLSDRLRLLLTGRLHIKLIQHLPVECAYSKNRFDWQIDRPGDRS